jgi:hypothetical protein
VKSTVSAQSHLARERANGDEADPPPTGSLEDPMAPSKLSSSCSE